MALGLKFKGASWGGEGQVCHLCAAPLNPDKTIWLELHCVRGTFHELNDPVPEADSQGCFPFGTACAKKVLKASRQYEMEIGDRK
jgi:hypothetical protein